MKSAFAFAAGLCLGLAADALDLQWYGTMWFFVWGFVFMLGGWIGMVVADDRA